MIRHKSVFSVAAVVLLWFRKHARDETAFGLILKYDFQEISCFAQVKHVLLYISLFLYVVILSLFQISSTEECETTQYADIYCEMNLLS